MLVRRLADDCARALSREFEGTPHLELLCWLELALRRESFVTAFYDARSLERLLTMHDQPSGDADARAAMRVAVLSVWAQESAHQAYLRAVLRAVSPPATLFDSVRRRSESIRGIAEGRLISALGGRPGLRQACAAFICRAAVFAGLAPTQLRELVPGTFNDFCALSADLEYTAQRGYERMLQLFRSLPDAEMAAGSIPTGSGLEYDLEHILLEEIWHERLFSILHRHSVPEARSVHLAALWSELDQARVRVFVDGHPASVHAHRAPHSAEGAFITYAGDEVQAGANEVGARLAHHDPWIRALRGAVGSVPDPSRGP